MSRPDVGPTVEAIRSMADQLREKAQRLDALASQMASTGDLELAAFAANIVVDPPVHMEWLIARPLQAIAQAAATPTV